MVNSSQFTSSRGCGIDRLVCPSQTGNRSSSSSSIRLYSLLLILEFYSPTSRTSTPRPIPIPMPMPMPLPNPHPYPNPALSNQPDILPLPKTFGLDRNLPLPARRTTVRELIRGMGVRGRGGGGGGGAGGGEQEQEQGMGDIDCKWLGKKVRVYGRVVKVSSRCECRGVRSSPVDQTGLGV